MKKNPKPGDESKKIPDSMNRLKFPSMDRDPNRFAADHIFYPDLRSAAPGEDFFLTVLDEKQNFCRISKIRTVWGRGG